MANIGGRGGGRGGSSYGEISWIDQMNNVIDDGLESSIITN